MQRWNGICWPLGSWFVLYHLIGTSFTKPCEYHSGQQCAVVVCASEDATPSPRWLPSDHQYANTVLRAMMYKRACLFVCLLQPYLFLRWPPSVHSEQWRDRDRVVSEGPAALETAHVLLLPEQLRGRMRPCALCTHSHSRPDLLTSPLLGGWTRRRGQTKTSHLTNFKICSFPQNSGSVTRS